jgi:hypothetical protein
MNPEVLSGPRLMAGKIALNRWKSAWDPLSFPTVKGNATTSLSLRVHAVLHLCVTNALLPLAFALRFWPGGFRNSLDCVDKPLGIRLETGVAGLKGMSSRQRF